ncbi:MAG TPA: efflux RND transporter periplasmic adaptor subunit [Bacteroidales bacterium]|nr:efflux RND transporter periplasmic adaptor subunit [Bacteroidales bacterium]HSA43835.1 efflux RND transporter periplasmic adaptor subunit [Bacteroidales bacterium]
MNKKYYLLLLPILLVAVFFAVKAVKKNASHAVSKSGPKLMPVQAECYLVRDSVLEFPFTGVGVIRANEAVDIVSELSLKVVSIPFREGSMVRKGDVLFELDGAELKASLDRVRTEHGLAVETEKRYRQLLTGGGVSQQSYDESFSRMKALEAEVRQLELRLEKTIIRAPFSGKAGLRNVSVGAYVSPGLVLTHIEDLSVLKIDIGIPESMAASVGQGDQLSFRLEGIPGTFQAGIEAVAPSLEPGTGNLKVRAVISGTVPGAVPGRIVSVSVRSRTVAPALYIPANAIQAYPSGSTVYRIENGKARAVTIITGLRSAGMVEATAGLQAGDTILLTGLMKVKPGSPVKVIQML